MLKRAGIAFVILLLGGFALGLFNLFQWRAQDGDIFPPYSSLRADPLGTRALYESFDRQDGLEVSRLYRPLNEVAGRQATLLVLGTSALALERVPESDHIELQNFMREGGRVIISLFPENDDPSQRGIWGRSRKTTETDEKKTKKKKERSGEDSSEKDDAKKAVEPEDKDKPKDMKAGPKEKRKRLKDEDEEEMERLFKRVSLPEVWGVEFKYKALAKDTNGVTLSAPARRMTDTESLPAVLTWHSALHFKATNDQWKVIYASEGNSVILERQFGRGSLVLASDSYLFSNEALRKEKTAGLLVWLLGANRTLFFDETHLGVEEQPGIAALIRKYQLHWLVFGLVALAGFYIWKNAVTFVPALEDRGEQTHELETGKDSASGFVNLLRRNVPAAELLNVCLSEWRKTRAQRGSDLSGRAKRVEDLVTEETTRPANQRDPVATYRKISQILTERR